MNLVRTMGVSLAALAVAIGCFGGAAKASSPFELDFLGQEIFASGIQYQGTTVGGLSGIDYDAATNSYIIISDDRSSAARFYGATIAIGDGVLSAGDVTFTSVTTLTQSGGVPYGANSIDPEGIRFLPGGGIVWSSEGEVSSTRIVNPAVFKATAAGVQTDSLTIPAQFIPNPPFPTTIGVRNNLAFESLTLSADKTKIFTATENALVQDGQAAAVGVGSPSRVLEFDLATGNGGRQFVYNTEPVALPPNPAGAFNTNGLVEMLAVDDTHFLMLERSFSVGAAGTPGNTGNTVRLFLASITGATDVSAFADLAAAGAYVPMTKELVIDFTTLGIPIDNVEGMTWGETLADGRRTLIFVSDNNFSPTQFTQFLAFAVTPVPLPAALPLFGGGLAVVALAARRRRG